MGNRFITEHQSRTINRENMADHSTIILFPLILFVLTSGMIEDEVENGETLWRKTSAIIAARPENLTSQQVAILNKMVSRMNANITQMVGLRNLEEFRSNTTAVQLVAETVKDDYHIYNNLVIHMLNLTEKDLEITRTDFCLAVPKICDHTYVIPSEFRSLETAATKVEELHKGHKDFITTTKTIGLKTTTEGSTTVKIIEESHKEMEKPMKETLKVNIQNQEYNMESLSMGLKSSKIWIASIVLTASFARMF